MKVICFLLLPLLIFLFGAEPLDAMERKRDELDIDSKLAIRPIKKRKTINGSVPVCSLLIGGKSYPKGKVPSLKNGLCYALAQKMESEDDVEFLEGLSPELIEQIQKVYSLISGKACVGPKISLDEMMEWVLISEDILDDNVQLRDLIIQRFVLQEIPLLELFLNALRRSKQEINYSVTAHDALVEVVSKFVQVKQQNIVEKYFEQLPEGSLKMAVRFVYAIKYYKNLDQYDCVGLLSPNIGRTCVFLDMIPSDENQNICYMSWHFDFSDRPSSNGKMSPAKPLCNQDMIPVVFSLIQPILKRIYPGNAQAMFKNVPFRSVNISGNEQDASPWLYLLPANIQQKALGEEFRNSWGLGPIKMVEESDIDPALFDALEEHFVA